jgi:NAD(P)-dependent dehydrogenase (short-subunit alcohol dehydrogenase family)/ferredoxin
VILDNQLEGERVADGAAGRVKGKVAFVTGAARGQGRSHAMRLAEEGADIIAVDLCCDIDTIGYPMAGLEDLDETARLIEKTGQGAMIAQADVRDAAQLRAALDNGLAEFGKLDIVVAQAGVAGMKGQPPLQAWCDVINTNLIGTLNAIQVALPHLSAGGSIIATGSTAALIDTSKKDVRGNDPGGMAYVHSKRALANYVHDLATELAPLGIRANVVHPTNCNTPMLQSEPMYRSFRPDLEHPTRADAEPVFGVQQAMKIPYIELEDISNAWRTSATPSCGWPPTRPDTSPVCSCASTPAATSSGTTTTTEPQALSGGDTVKVWVDSERCQGHTLCSMIAPDSFQLSDIDGSSSAIDEVVPADRQDRVREAAQSCPEQAIIITDDASAGAGC